MAGVTLDIRELKKLENIEAVFKAPITPSGNGGHISCQKKYLGKDAIVFIISDG